MFSTIPLPELPSTQLFQKFVVKGLTPLEIEIGLVFQPRSGMGLTCFQDPLITPFAEVNWELLEIEIALCEFAVTKKVVVRFA